MKLLPILLGLGLVACISAYSQKEEEEKFKDVLSPAAEPSAPTRKRRPYTGRLPSGLHKHPQGAPAASLPAPRPSLPTYSLPLQEKAVESKSKGDEHKKYQTAASEAVPSAPLYAQSSYSIQLEPYYRPDDNVKAQDNSYASGSASYPVHIPNPNAASYPVHIATSAPQYPAKVQVVATTVRAPTTTKLPKIPPGGNIKSGYNHITNTHIYATSATRPQPTPAPNKPQPKPIALRPIYLPNFPQHLQGIYPVQFLPNFHQVPPPQYQVQHQSSGKKEEKHEVHAQEEEKAKEEEEEQEEEDNNKSKEQDKEYSKENVKGEDKGNSEGQHNESGEGQYNGRGVGYRKENFEGQYRGREQGQYKGREEPQYRIRVETQYKGRDETSHKGRYEEQDKGRSEEQDKEKDEEKDEDKDEEEENKENSEGDKQEHKAGGSGQQVSGYQVHQTHEYRAHAFPAYRPQQQKVEYRPATQSIAVALRPQPIQAHQVQPQVSYNRAQIPVFQIHVQNLPTFKHHEAYKSQVQSFPVYTQQVQAVQPVQAQESKPQAPAQASQGYHQKSVSNYQASVAPAYQQQSVVKNQASAYQQQSVANNQASAYQQQSAATNYQGSTGSTHQQQAGGSSYQVSAAPAYQQQSTSKNHESAYQQQSVGATYQTSSVPAYHQQSVSNYQVVSVQSQPAQGYQSEEAHASEEEKSEPEGQQEVYPEDYSAIPGEGGRDYPQIFRIPSSGFTCVGKLPGYYADVELKCQVWYICDIDSRKDSFLCPNGTVYNQERFVCDWWYNVDCSKSENFFHLNEELYKVPEKKQKVEISAPASQYEQKEQSSGYGGGHQYQSVQTSYQQVSQPSYVVSLPSIIPPVAVSKHQVGSGYGSGHSDSEEKSSNKGSKTKKAEKQKPKKESEEEEENHQSGY